MRPAVAAIVAASLVAIAGVVTPAASGEGSALKACGTLVVRQPAGFRPSHVSGTLKARRLTCHEAKIAARSVARRYRDPTSFKVRRNTYDCEGSGGDISCFGVRPGDEEPTVGFTFVAKRR